MSVGSNPAAFWNAQANFKVLDAWISNLNAQSAGTATIGLKAKRTSFSGTAITERESLTSGRQRQGAEQILGRNEVYDWSQGAIVSSSSEWHAGIRGEGLYAVAKDLNPGTQVYYTRNGEFHLDDTHNLRTPQGHYLLMRGDIDQTNPLNPHVIGTAAIGAKSLEPFSIKRTLNGGDADDFTDGIDTTIWNVVGAPVVDAAGVHIDNFSGGSEGITSVGSYTGSGTFDVTMRFDAFPTNVSVASDYALGLQGGGANAPHILVTDGAYPGSTFNDTDGGIADGPNAYFHTGVASATSMPPGPLAANGLPYHSAPQSTVYLWKPGSIVDAQFHKYRMEWTSTNSKFYFDGNLVSWSNVGAVGTSTVAFQFANNLAAGAGTAITVRDFSFITNNPITINGMVPGMKAEVRDRSGILVGNGTANALGAVTLPTTILTPMPYTGAQIWVYAADGTFVGSQTLTDSSGLNGGDTYSVSMFQFAKFDDLSRLAWSKIGNQYLDAGTQVGTFLSSGTMGAGKLIRYALEASNTSVQQLAPEISLAKTVYANLTKVLEAKIMNLDAIMALIR